MTSGPHPKTSPPRRALGDVDVLVVGAGITGIYQLYLALESGFSALLLEAGDGVGGTWYWNRYPEARFDSESYTYAYIFSKELFEEWDWQQHFSPQPETEKYLNYVVDKFDLRPRIRLGAKVTSAVYDDSSTTWTVRASDGSESRARVLIAATGVLSEPYFPAVPGREDFLGVQLHTGLWPSTPVDLVDKRVAVVGTGSSGVQLIPAIADEVASLTVYQRSANWCTPLNNRPITPEEQAKLKAGFEELRDTLIRSRSGFLHLPYDRATFDDSKEERLAYYQKLWNSPGFAKFSSNYTDMLTDEAANAEWCEFIAEKIRSIVNDSETAEKLIPRDHGYGGKRPPFVTGYYETFNEANVRLVDLKANPMVRVTAGGIETTEGFEHFDVIVWASGFDFGTGALNRMGVRGRDGRRLEEYWADGPRTYLGLMCHGFPNFYFPGGPHGSAGNNPRYSGDQSEFINDLLVYQRTHGFVSVEVPEALEQEWTVMVDTEAEKSGFGKQSYFYGLNIPGKPRRYLINPAGRPTLLRLMSEVVETDYKGFFG
jgi:cation diffusion facilitator CzcD-associated flavoprotein CzcO